ncbi:MAG: S4 domain-containing protein [Candidatus Thorarchaeota archaeon]|jgi:23S rRNA (cytidine1920-2'-O)/16S rRNA (cytidine1409-2'-O)-methyltransferase
MPRLDQWLVETGKFSSRQVAKRAIKEGHVTVNGNIAKPSKQVTGNESITISEESSSHPSGYSKLMKLDSLLDGLVISGMHALDIGSSAGGFLIYLASKGVKVTAIEVSDTFRDTLTKLVESYPGISLIMGDAFSVDPFIISGEQELDLLLIDVTTDSAGTLKLIEQFSILLKLGGHLIASFKLKPQISSINETRMLTTKLGYTKVLDFVLDKNRQEFHIVAIRQ